MTLRPEPTASVADTPVTAEVRPAVAPARVAAAQLELLDGDEIIQLSIKPSPWFILLESARALGVVALAVGALTLAMSAGYTTVSLLPFQVLIALGALRVGLAMLQWASRLYVLTNRRIMRFRGVLAVQVAACPLTRISEVTLETPWAGYWLRTGTIRLRAADPDAPPLDWNDVARPHEVHDILTRAVRKAQQNGERKG
jgi:hypothetical protein